MLMANSLALVLQALIQRLVDRFLFSRDGFSNQKVLTDETKRNRPIVKGLLLRDIRSLNFQLNSH